MSSEEKYNDLLELLPKVIHLKSEYGVGCSEEEFDKVMSLVKELLDENKKLNKYKSYLDSLYGQGYEVANYHLNGDLEPLDNFLDDAEDSM